MLGTAVATILMSIAPRPTTASKLPISSQNVAPVGYCTASGSDISSTFDSWVCLSELVMEAPGSRPSALPEMRLIACSSMHSASIVAIVRNTVRSRRTCGRRYPQWREETAESIYYSMALGGMAGFCCNEPHRMYLDSEKLSGAHARIGRVCCPRLMRDLCRDG